MKPTTELPTKDGYYWRRQLLEGEVSAEQVVQVDTIGEECVMVRYLGKGIGEALREPSSPDVKVEWYGPLASPWKEEE